MKPAAPCCGNRNCPPAVTPRRQLIQFGDGNSWGSPAAAARWAHQAVTPTWLLRFRNAEGSVNSIVLFWETRGLSTIRPGPRRNAPVQMRARQFSLQKEERELSMAAMGPEQPSSTRPVQIVADDRERTALVVGILSAMEGVQVVTERLKIGDYQIQEW